MSKKIYITSLHLKHGGCEYVVSTLANAFYRRGYDVEILCSYNFNEIAYPIENGVKITYLTNVLPNRDEFKAAVKNKKIFSALREAVRASKILKLKYSTMKKAIQSIDDGVIISTREEFTPILSKYGKKNVTKIAQLHNDHKFNKKLIKEFQNSYSNIDYFVLLTPQTTNEIKEFMLGHNDYTQCITIPNFLETIDKVPCDGIKKQVIAAGRLHPDKDFFSLLRIWKCVVAKHPEYKLKLAGEGEQRDALISYAEELNISDNVIFWGNVPHNILLKEMGESIAYALTSVSESFSLVIAEAMSQGTPCVSFDIRVGPGFLIRNNENGFLIKDRNEIEFANKLCQLIENAELREEMSKKSVARSLDFSEETIMNQWINIIE